MNDSPPTDPALILLDFEDWATHRMFDACEPLSDADLDRPFEMGLGSLRKTLMHDVGAMIGWTGVLAESPPVFSPVFGSDSPSINMLRDLHVKAMEAFRATATMGSFEDVLETSRNGVTHRYGRGGVLTHVTTHSMHHRAQCLNMLRHVGVEDLPESSVFQWMRAFPPKD